MRVSRTRIIAIGVLALFTIPLLGFPLAEYLFVSGSVLSIGDITVYNPDTRTPIYSEKGAQGYYHLTDPWNNTTWAVQPVGQSGAIPYLYGDLYPTTRLSPPESQDLPNLGIGGLPIDPYTELGIADFRLLDARSYQDGGTLRFLNPDPLGYIDGPNTYQYVTGFGVSPLTDVDPEGLDVLQTLYDQQRPLERTPLPGSWENGQPPPPIHLASKPRNPLEHDCGYDPGHRPCPLCNRLAGNDRWRGWSRATGYNDIIDIIREYRGKLPSTFEIWKSQIGVGDSDVAEMVEGFGGANPLTRRGEATVNLAMAMPIGPVRKVGIDWSVVDDFIKVFGTQPQLGEKELLAQSVDKLLKETITPRMNGNRNIIKSLSEFIEPFRSQGPQLSERVKLLNPLQHQVLIDLTQGVGNKQIAYDLSLTPKTVEHLRARVMKNMGAESAGHLGVLTAAAASSDQKMRAILLDPLLRESPDLYKRLELLTAREGQVLLALMQGQQNKAIGVDLGVVVRTVEVHRTNLMVKMGAESPTNLTFRAATAALERNSKGASILALGALSAQLAEGAVTTPANQLSLHDAPVPPSTTTTSTITPPVTTTTTRTTTTSSTTTTLPGLPKPTGVSAEDGVSFADRIYIHFNTVIGGTYYRLYRNTVNNSATAAATVPWAPFGNGTQIQPQVFGDLAATPGVDYYYWVRASTSNTGTNASSFSDPDLGWLALSIPQNVIATDGAYPNKVNISWNAVTGASHYRVYRKDSLNNLIELSAWQTGRSFDDFTATPVGAIYRYFIKAAVSSTGYKASEFSAGDTGSMGNPLSAPGSVLASEWTYNDGVHITWASVTGASHYRVYRTSAAVAPSPSSPNQLPALWQTGTSPSEAQTYTDTSAVPGVSYYYWVKAATSGMGENESGFSLYDKGINGLRAPETVTALPDGVAADGIYVMARESCGASYYSLYKNTVNSTLNLSQVVGWSYVAPNLDCNNLGIITISNPSGGISYDYQTDPNKTYYYWVRAATDSSGAHPSPYTNPPATNPPDTASRLLVPPKNISATNTTPSTEIIVSFGSSVRGVYFKVYRSTSNNTSAINWSSPWTVTPCNTFTQTCTINYHNSSGTTSGTQYYYWAKFATDSAGTNASAYSNNGIGVPGKR